MRQEIISIYKLKELPEDIQEKAIKNLSDITVDFEWWDGIYCDADNIGLKITGFAIDRHSYVEGYFIGYAIETAKKILKDHGKDCETYRDAKAYLKRYGKELKIWLHNGNDFDDFETKELDHDFLYNLREDYRIILTKEYEYLTSREHIIEIIEENEYEFYEDGSLY